MQICLPPKQRSEPHILPPPSPRRGKYCGVEDPRGDIPQGMGGWMEGGETTHIHQRAIRAVKSPSPIDVQQHHSIQQKNKRKTLGSWAPVCLVGSLFQLLGLAWPRPLRLGVRACLLACVHVLKLHACTVSLFVCFVHCSVGSCSNKTAFVSYFAWVARLG